MYCAYHFIKKGLLQTHRHAEVSKEGSRNELQDSRAEKSGETILSGSVQHLLSQFSAKALWYDWYDLVLPKKKHHNNIFQHII